MNFLDPNSEIENLFKILSAHEGERFDQTAKEAFVNMLFPNLDIPKFSNIINHDFLLPWGNLQTGDLAIFSNGIEAFLGVVIGKWERQFAFVDPTTQVIRVVYYDERIDNFYYVNGAKVSTYARKQNRIC